MREVPGGRSRVRSERPLKLSPNDSSIVLSRYPFRPCILTQVTRPSACFQSCQFRPSGRRGHKALVLWLLKNANPQASAWASPRSLTPCTNPPGVTRVDTKRSDHQPWARNLAGLARVTRRLKAYSLQKRASERRVPELPLQSLELRPAQLQGPRQRW